MPKNIDPNMAVDLSKQQQAVDLSAEALKARKLDARKFNAAVWVNRMQRTFSGIAGNMNNRQRIALAIEKFDLREESDA